MKNIVIIGGGILGSQIAFQSAYNGFNVAIWSRSEDSKNKSHLKIEELKNKYIETIQLMNTPNGKTINSWARGISDYENFDAVKCLENVEKAYKNINLSTDLKEIIKDADLVIESMTENFEVKKDFYKKIAYLLPEKTIIVTNSSTILPSKLAKYTGRDSKFLSLHFSNSIWKNNTAEVMCHPKTDSNSFEEVLNFAKEIRMIPLPLKKEKSGYLLNSMLIPLLFSGLDLLVNEISDPNSIDKAWTLGTGAPKGPFQILDIIGLNTAYNIVLMYVKIPSFLAPYDFKKIERLLKQYIDEGKLGITSGEGFYKYNTKE